MKQDGYQIVSEAATTIEMMEPVIKAKIQKLELLLHMPQTPPEQRQQIAIKISNLQHTLNAIDAHKRGLVYSGGPYKPSGNI